VSEHACTCAAEAEQVDLSLLEPVLADYADDHGALIPVLQHAQQLYGYLPEEALREIAVRRETPLSTVYGVVTFYGQFHLQPRGKTIVKICHGTACHVGGATEVTHAITDELGVELGTTSEDMNFTVEAVACVGCCGLAPVVVTDGQVHGQVSAGDARKLAKKLRREAANR
jgi:NADH:ubiquinone oxidoreductase subunit E